MCDLFLCADLLLGPLDSSYRTPSYLDDVILTMHASLPSSSLSYLVRVVLLLHASLTVGLPSFTLLLHVSSSLSHFSIACDRSSSSD
jgi:hypothetical protein